MENMQTTILVIHTLIALAIVALVLIQRGKGADAGAAFGSGASGTVFGSRGTTSFFSRATALLATAFFATSLSLAYISSQRTGAPDSILETLPADDASTVEAPAVIDVEDVPEMPELDGDNVPVDDAVPPLDSDEPAAEQLQDAPPDPQ